MSLSKIEETRSQITRDPENSSNAKDTSNLLSKTPNSSSSHTWGIKWKFLKDNAPFKPLRENLEKKKRLKSLSKLEDYQRRSFEKSNYEEVDLEKEFMAED